MKRYRFLGADWPLAMPTIATRLKGAPFSDEVGDGFVLDRVRPNTLEGRYFEKIVVNDSIENPFGETFNYERVTYREVHFKFSKSYPQIECRNPPRSLRVFINRIAELLDFKVAVEPLVVDPVQWAERIKISNDLRGSVKSIEISGLAIDAHTTARFALVSEQDVLVSAAKLIANRPHIVEKVKVEIETDLGSYGLQLFADGAVRMADEVPEDIVEFIRNALPESKIPAM